MRVICAPDSFKESITATAAAEAMARGVHRASAHASVDLFPIGDGGEGTVDAMLAAWQGLRRITRVSGPTGTALDAAWGVWRDGRTAVIEMAAAAGLANVPADQRDPTRTSTLGVGQLIADALRQGVEKVIVGIGGSATNDAGCGMAQALGVRFFDATGSPIDKPITGGMLHDVAHIDPGKRLPALMDAQIVAACDVTNPLVGPNGAAHVYAPQKGATPQQVQRLDAGLSHLADVIKRDLGIDVDSIPGAGAAGGLGAGLIAFADATLQPGIELILEAVGFDERAQGCNLCLTGEGRIDGQSLSGKACVGVARAARKVGTPTVALVGSRGPGAERALDEGLIDIVVIGEGLPAEASMRRAAALIEAAAERVVCRYLRNT